MIRTSIFVAVGLITLTTSPVVFALVAGLYSIKWYALEWLILAALIDVVFSVSSVPQYLIATALALIIVEWLRSVFSLY